MLSVWYPLVWPLLSSQLSFTYTFLCLQTWLHLSLTHRLQERCGWLAAQGVWLLGVLCPRDSDSLSSWYKVWSKTHGISLFMSYHVNTYIAEFFLQIVCRSKLPDDMQESVIQTLSIQALGQVTHLLMHSRLLNWWDSYIYCMGFNL